MPEQFHTSEDMLQGVEDTRHQLQTLQARLESLSFEISTGGLELDDADVLALGEWLDEIEHLASSCASLAAQATHTLGSST
ncbi:MAG: hypothetical protein M3281_08460 [Chloroflexota bacterium]|nr:hypothetical protein [Chloroflexota bacterium]